jgi:predicted Zn-dependent protease
MGLIGLVVIVLGVKQIYEGVHEMSGTSAASTQKLGETFASVENGYSHRIPEGWQIKPSPQAGVVAMIVSPSESGVSSNMVTTVEPFDGSLTDYVAANKQAVSAQAPTAKFLNDAQFVTDSKATARKVKTEQDE